MKYSTKVRGFSLIEVLVGMLIITAGAVGFVTLQSKILKSEQNTDYQQLAMQLSMAKLDDLASFVDVADNVGQFDYNDIANNLGGALASGDVDVALSADNGEVHTFNRQWRVINQYYVDTDGDGNKDTWVEAGSADAPIPLPAVPGQKLITVNVSWTNLNGADKNVIVDGTLAPVPVGRSIQVTNESDSVKQSPIVSYTPGEAPDVISYELGNGENIETSKPVPEINNNGDNTIVNFETVRYIQLDGDTDKLEQEDFITLNCSCELAGEYSGKTPSMTILAGDKMITESGTYTNKMTGVPANNRQAPLCTACCRDHHDTVEMIASETYYLEENGIPHKHYELQTNGNFSRATSTGDPYDEICRFKRVDGLFEMYPDWELLDIMQFSDQYLFDPLKLAEYIDYSEALITSNIRNTTTPVRPSGREREVTPGGYQYVARGIYLDRMKSAHKTQVLSRIAEGDDTWKAITPFYDINLTLLANWSTDDPAIADVTQEEIQSIVDPANDYYGTYSRGRLQAQTDGVTHLRAFAYSGNAGISGSSPISAPSAGRIREDADVEITVDARSSSERFFGLVGDIECLITISGVTEACETNNSRRNNYVDLSTLFILESPSQFSCEVSVPRGRATPFYSCENVSENWNGVIQFGMSVPNASVSITIDYPNGSTNTSGSLNLPSGISGTSTGEYNVIINVVK